MKKFKPIEIKPLCERYLCFQYFRDEGDEDIVSLILYLFRLGYFEELVEESERRLFANSNRLSY